MPVLSRNGLVVLPEGTPFCLAGTAPDPLPKMATNTLAYVRNAQGVVDQGGGLVTSPQGIYVTLAEVAYDQGGTSYAQGTVLSLGPNVPVQVAAKVAGKAGEGFKVQYQAAAYPWSATNVALGVVLTAAGALTCWLWFG